MMIAETTARALPEPDFEATPGEFVIILWRDWLTTKRLLELDLTERQLQAVAFVKKQGRITNSEHQGLTLANRKTAARDLDELVVKGVFLRIGEKRGTHYVLTTKK